MLLSSSRLVPSVPRALKNTPIPLLSRFKSSTASTASKSLAPPSKSPHPIFQIYRPPALFAGKVPKQHYLSSSNTSSTSLTDDEFNRLPPFEQTKIALLNPVPTSIVPLYRASLRDAVDEGVKSKPEGEASGESLKWSLQKLAWYGDRLWDQIVAEVLLVIELEGVSFGKDSKLGSIATLKQDLVSNDIGARLAVEAGLTDGYEIASSARQHLWEAYLAALFIEKGRRGLLDFLAPIVKSEFDRLRPLKLARLKQPGFFLSKEEKETLRILKLERLQTIQFPSLEAARTDFDSVLNKQNLPYLLKFSPSGHSATLQLPGVPLLAVQAQKKTQEKQPFLKAKLAKQAIAKGYFKVSPTPPTKILRPASSKTNARSSSVPMQLVTSPLVEEPLIFRTLASARKEWFGSLSARKIKFQCSKARAARRTLIIEGLPPITSKAATKQAHRLMLLEGAIKLGIVKLETSTPSPKSAS